MNITYFDADRRMKLNVPNTSNLTLPMVFVRAALEGDLIFAENNGHTASVLTQIRNKIRNYSRFPNTLKKSAIELLLNSGIDPNYDFGISSYSTLARLFPDYHLQVYTRLPPAKFYSVCYEENSEQSKKLYIAHYKGKFDVFKPCRATIGKTICNKCFVIYTKSSQHQCTFSCFKCRVENCSGQKIPLIMCAQCNETCETQQCFDNHKRPGKRGGKSTCEMLKRCVDCGERYRPSNYRDGATHVCGDRIFCRNCQQHVNPNSHNCCWAIPTEKSKQKRRRIKRNSKFWLTILKQSNCKTPGI